MFWAEATVEKISRKVVVTVLTSTSTIAISAQAVPWPPRTSITIASGYSVCAAIATSNPTAYIQVPPMK